MSTPTTQPPAETLPAPVAPASALERRVTVEQLALLPDSAERTNWIKALVNAEVARLTYAQDRALARDAAASGVFDDLKNLTPEQGIATALIKIQLGRNWGFNQADSLRSIYFVGGRPAIENSLIADKLYEFNYSWDTEWIEQDVLHKGSTAKKCVGCTLWLKHRKSKDQPYEPMLDRNGVQLSVSFTEFDADTAMIYEKGKTISLSEKWNFKSWPRDMYFWRCIGRVKKYHAPHVLSGAFSRDEAAEMAPVELAPQPREIEAGGPQRLNARNVILHPPVDPDDVQLEDEPTVDLKPEA